MDGVDVRRRTQADLRAGIGFVPQKASLFSGTIAENIRYGKEDATDEEVRRAAEIAQALEFIEAMEHGFDAVVAQGGANLSGGQRQRLTIARALVRRPRMYVFDDSFSALDFRTDAKLREALRRETADATVIIVAQRVATIMDADQIIVLDEGRVAGIGAPRGAAAHVRRVSRDRHLAAGRGGGGMSDDGHPWPAPAGSPRLRQPRARTRPAVWPRRHGRGRRHARGAGQRFPGTLAGCWVTCGPA